MRTLAEGSEALDYLAEANDKLVRCLIDFRDKPGIAGITHNADIRHLGPVGAIGMFLSADLRDGSTVIWNLEVEWVQKWTIDLVVRRLDDNGSHDLASYPQLRASTPIELKHHLHQSVQTIRESLIRSNFEIGEYRDDR
jgi:hypothetical protein